MTAPRRVGEVLRELALHPVDRIILRWNWKTAVLSAMLRGAIFFFAVIPEGLAPAAAALGRDVIFRVPLAGLYGAIIQAFSNTAPVWGSYLVVTLGLPAVAHLAEFLVHWIGGTPRLGTAITASVLFSAFSAVFNLFLMRRGALLVGASSGGLGADLRRIPRLLAEAVPKVPGMPKAKAKSEEVQEGENKPNREVGK